MKISPISNRSNLESNVTSVDSATKVDPVAKFSMENISISNVENQWPSIVAQENPWLTKNCNNVNRSNVSAVPPSIPPIPKYPPKLFSIRGRNTGTSMKVVPKRAMCFATRLDKETTENLLQSYLEEAGLREVSCKKMVPKEGQKFYTAAFRVSCCEDDKDKLFDCDLWPAGVEVREWVFHSKSS